MVLNRRIPDINLEPVSKFKFYQCMMEINAFTGRRWNLSGVPIQRESIIGIPTSGKRPPTASEVTTHQKIHRIIEQNDKRKSKAIDRSSKSLKSSNGVLPNYKIIRSRCQSLRGCRDNNNDDDDNIGDDDEDNNDDDNKNFDDSLYDIRGNSIKNQFSGLSLRYHHHHNKSSNYDCQLVNNRGEDATRCERDKNSLLSNNNWERRREIERSNLRTKNICISKSSSVPANLKEGLEYNSSGKIPIDGILKKSSIFVDKLIDDNRISLLKKKNQLTKNRCVNNTLLNLKKSPSCQNLNINYAKNANNSGNISSVKKSVSFSLDTNFSKKQTGFNKKIAAVHESKVYRKGVLRDVNDVVTPKKQLCDLSLSITKETKMSQALLKAARDADELALTDLISRMRRSSLNHCVDINATDSSGRSAISYIATNGADEVLNVVLSLPGINPNLPDNEGNTPLHFAAQAGQAESLNILLQRCTVIELDARNVLGFTPLMKAALQGRTKCAKILLFAGANPTLRDYGRGFKAEQWARFCGRHMCADIIERFSRHKFMEKSTCRWGSEPELATKVLQGKIVPIPLNPIPMQSSGFKSKIKRVFKSSNSDKSFSIVSQLTNAALCASTPALPKPGDIQPVKSLIRPLIVPQLRVTLVAPTDILEKKEASHMQSDNSVTMKPSKVKKKNK